MRNFEERKTEVLRRSELKIKEKKQRRNRIIVCCVPVFVCCIGLVLGLVVVKKPAAYVPEVTEDVAMQGQNTNTATNSMTVASNDYSIYLTSYEESQIEEVQGLLQDIFYTGTEVDPGKQQDNFAGEASSNEDYLLTQSISSYIINITGENGEKEAYMLRDNTLVNMETKQEYVLKEEQADMIKEALLIESE